MPPGPTPKPAEKRARRNEPTFEQTELDGGKTTAPRLVGRTKLTAATRRWWDTWVESPQAAQFLATDWERLMAIARLVDDFWRADEPKVRRELMAEIRLQEAKLGATPEDRLRLRWRMREADQAESKGAKAKTRPPRRRSDPRLSLVGGDS